MKRAWIIAALVVLMVVGGYAVFAQSQQGPGRGMGQRQMGPATGQGPMGPGMMMQQGAGGMGCPMCGMMGGAMMQKNIVQIDDGFIVAVADKLIKYDNDLNKVKEVTLDVDVVALHQKMMQNCPMMQQMQRQQNAQVP